jgi:hypothetical protein
LLQLKSCDLITTILYKHSCNVFIFDPRGIGAAKSHSVKKDLGTVYDTEYKLNCDALMMGTSLAALRIYDVIRACDYIKKRQEGIVLNIEGKGVCSFYALAAAILVNGVSCVYIKEPMPSFEELVKTKFYKNNNKYSIFSILKEFDMPWMIDELRKSGCSVSEL